MIDRENVRDAVQLVEEQAVIRKHDVSTGRVLVKTKTETVDQNLDVELGQDSVEVVRVPKNEPVVGTPPQIRTEGEVTIVPILEEVVVVEKRLVLKEELHVYRRRDVERLNVPITLKRQTVDVVRTSIEDTK